MQSRVRPQEGAGCGMALQVMPKLRDAGVCLLDYEELQPGERQELRDWFIDKVRSPERNGNARMNA